MGETPASSRPVRSRMRPRGHSRLGYVTGKYSVRVEQVPAAGQLQRREITLGNPPTEGSRDFAIKTLHTPPAFREQTEGTLQEPHSTVRIPVRHLSRSTGSRCLRLKARSWSQARMAASAAQSYPRSSRRRL